VADSRAHLDVSSYLVLGDVQDLVGAIANVIMDRFDNEAAIATCTSPTLIIHGRVDELIPVKHASGKL
jgi:fermentation-respiration switch protein FrsA (DUF1100 family)